MHTAQTTRLDRLKQQLEATDRLRETLSYKATLDRGYAVVRAEGNVITTKAQAAKQTALEIEFADGVLSTGPAEKSPSKKPRPDAPDQGSLF